MKDEARKLSSLQLLVQLLPANNFTLLQQLLSLLAAVDREPDNLMTAHSLAIVFTIHIIIPKKVTRSSITLNRFKPPV
jgi:hypothetical protein